MKESSKSVLCVIDGQFTKKKELNNLYDNVFPTTNNSSFCIYIHWLIAYVS